MTKREWLWLFIWLLIFFLLFCTWDKSKKFTKSEFIEQNISTPAQSKKKVVSSDISLKAFKESFSKDIKLSGTVSTNKERENIIDSFSKIFDKVNADNLDVKSSVKSKKLDIDTLSSFAPYLKNFDSGYIEYENGSLVIDGVTYNSATKDDIDEISKLIREKGIEVEDILTFQSPPPKEFPWKEILNSDESNETNITVSTNKYNNINTDKNSTKDNNSSNDTNSTNGDENNSSRDKNSTNIEKLTAAELQKTIDNILKKSRVHFIYAKDVMTNKSQITVGKIIQLLKKYKKFNIEIGGYTDSDGTKKRNKVLSQKRSNAILNYLVAHGIDAKRLKAVGYGESKPLVPNISAKNKKLNRRVEFKVLGEKK